MIQRKGGDKMAKHPPLKRTMRKGIRPTSSRMFTPPPNIRRETIEKMRNFLFGTVLVDGKSREELDKRQLFSVDQVHLVILFHRGEKSFQEVEKHSEKGYRVGFNEEQISALNFVLLEEKQRGQLETLLKKLKGKIKKEEAKK